MKKRLERVKGFEPSTSALATRRSTSELHPRSRHLVLLTEAHSVISGGRNRDRTDDLKLAKLALSQLSYAPILI